MRRRRGRPTRRTSFRRREPDAFDLVLIQQAVLADPVTVELDRPLAFRPRLVGFWRGSAFSRVTRVLALRWEHGVTFYRVLTDAGAFDLRHARRMDPVTLRVGRHWELCAEHAVIPLARAR